MCVAYTRKVSPTGFGYPLGDLSDLNPGKRISASNALGVHPSELFSSPVIERFSRILLSALALSYKTRLNLVAALQRFDPTEEAVPLSAPEGLVRVRTSCSLGSFNLSGSPSLKSQRKVSLFPATPLALRKQKPHGPYFHEPQGRKNLKPWLFPLRDAGPSGLFHRLRPPPF